jgi:hypothetical protein
MNIIKESAVKENNVFGEGPVKLFPLPQPPVRARTDARTNPSAPREPPN